MTEIIIGPIVLDVRGLTGDGSFTQPFEVVISGGAFNALAAAALTNSPATAITTLDRRDSVFAAIRESIQRPDITSFVSQQGMNPRLSVYTTLDAIKNKVPTLEIQYDQSLIFNPNAIPAIEAPEIYDAALFLSTLTTRDSTRAHMLDYARKLGGQKIPVVLNINSRAVLKPDIIQAWAQLAQIVTMSVTDIMPMFGSSVSPDSAAHQFLAASNSSPTGTKLVIVTLGEKGSRAYWNKGGQQISLNHIVSDQLYGDDQYGAGDSFAFGVAKAAGMFNLAQNNRRTLSPDNIRGIMQQGHAMAIEFLFEKNKPMAQRMRLFQPIRALSGKTAYEITEALGYPPPR